MFLQAHNDETDSKMTGKKGENKKGKSETYFSLLLSFLIRTVHTNIDIMLMMLMYEILIRDVKSQYNGLKQAEEKIRYAETLRCG